MLFSILVFPKLITWFNCTDTYCQFKPQVKSREPTQVYCKTFYVILEKTARIISINFTDVVFKILMWSYLECCVLLFFWVNKEKFCILALNAYNQYEYIIIWDVNSNTGLLMHWITEVMWLTDCKLKMNNHQGLVPEIFIASKAYVHLWDSFMAPAHHCRFMFHHSRLCSSSAWLAHGT